VVRQQVITHPNELVEVEVREVRYQQFPRTTALGQPAIGSQINGRQAMRATMTPMAART
jgi:hypothetical protein